MQQLNGHLPRAHEIRPVEHHGLGQGDLGFGVVAGKVIETADKRRPENVRQILAMNASLALCGERDIRKKRLSRIRGGHFH